MRKRQCIIVPAVCCMLALMPLPAYAATYQTEVTNGVSIGDVSISLKEYEYDESGKEIPYQDNKVILPGQTDHTHCQTRMDPRKTGICIKGWSDRAFRRYVYAGFGRLDPLRGLLLLYKTGAVK